MRALKMLAVIVIVLWFCGAPIDSATQEKHAGSVEIQMKNVNFRLASDIVLEVRSLRGRLERTNPEVPVTFDDSASFLVDIDSGEVAITPASLTALMNSYVLAYDGAPIKNVAMTIEGDGVILKGKIHKGI